MPNPVECAKYLLGENCFAQDIVYTSVREWNAKKPAEQGFSEIHMADWWCTIPVCCKTRFHNASISFHCLINWI